MKDDLYKAIEQVLLNHIKVIGDNEQTYMGYPADLIETLTQAAYNVIPTAEMQEA